MSEQTLTQTEPIFWRGCESHMHVVRVEVGEVKAEINTRTQDWMVTQRISIHYIDGSYSDITIHFKRDCDVWSNAVGAAPDNGRYVHIDYIPVPADAELA